MSIWLTGQPGSGKTTLAKIIEELNDVNNVIHLDGDDLRAINKNQDYSKRLGLIIYLQQYQLLDF